MELLYNPEHMKRASRKDAGVQHVLIIAPRGMGKTTVLLMLQLEMRDRGLTGRWQPIKFREESYGINDLADFWIEVLSQLAAQRADTDLAKRIEELKSEHTDSDELGDAALALLKDWSRKHRRRLVVMAENFDTILGQINDEIENARLRKELMNEGTVMLLGSATSFFREARAYDEPLYNFFKIYNLDDLPSREIRELLCRRAKADGMPDFDRTLKANSKRLRVLEYFAGGNPRLVLMLYRVVTKSELLEVRRALGKLLDEVTPYYQAKTERLPPQQRKILDSIARASAKTHEGQTPTQIARETRLKPNQVSSQLKRLSELGYVRAANLRSRSSYYTLSEPLYAVWYQMRFGRDARERMHWLVDFLGDWYGTEELQSVNRRLEIEFERSRTTGALRKAREVLETRRYLVQAMPESAFRSEAVDKVVRGYLELGEVETLKEELSSGVFREYLRPETVKALTEGGYFGGARSATAPPNLGKESLQGPKSPMELGIEAFEDGRLADAVAHFEDTVKISPEDYDGWLAWGFALGSLGRYEEAVRALERAVKINPQDYAAWFNQGTALANLGRYEDAVTSFNRAVKLKPQECRGWLAQGSALAELQRFEEALASFHRAAEIKPEDYDAWFCKGRALAELQRYEEALASFQRATEIKPAAYEAWFRQGVVLGNLGRDEEALGAFERAVKINPQDYGTWCNQGVALGQLGRYEEALRAFERAVKINPQEHGAWCNEGLALRHLGRYEEALGAFERAVKIKPQDAAAWANKGAALKDLGRSEEALGALERAVKINPQDDASWFNQGVALRRLGRYEEALAAFERAAKISPQEDATWSNQGAALRHLGRYEEALRAFKRAVKINPQDAAALTNQGAALAHLGRYEEALGAFERAVKINPQDYAAWSNRGAALTNLGRHEEALGALERAVKLKPQEYAAWFHQGAALEELRRHEEAITSFESALANLDSNEQAEQCLETHLAIFSNRIGLGQVDLARSNWRQALQYGESLGEAESRERFSSALIEAAQRGHSELVRGLIAESNWEERLFPLARALDYLKTGDEALVEKLSPEIRKIVDEIISKLRPASVERTPRRRKRAKRGVRRKAS